MATTGNTLQASKVHTFGSGAGTFYKIFVHSESGRKIGEFEFSDLNDVNIFKKRLDSLFLLEHMPRQRRGLGQR